MKNRFLKNSLVLAVSICIVLTNSAGTYAVWPNCDKLNENGQFDDLTCAIVDSVEKISNGEKFIKLDNIGYNSEYKLLFFDSSEINGVLSNLTYNKNVDQIIAMKEQELENSNKAISEGIFSLAIGGTCFSVLRNIYNALNLPNGKKEHGNKPFMQLAANPRLIFQRIQNVAIFIPLAIATGISILISGLACSVNSYFANKDLSDFIISSKSEKGNYFLILKMILNHLEDGDLTINKILCLSTDIDVKGSAVKILDKKVSKNYSLDEQNKFNESIENLKENITSILNQVNE